MPSLDRNNNMTVELESVNFKLASGCLSTILRKFNKKPGTFPTLLWPLSNCEVNRLQWSFGSAYTRPDDPLMLVNTDRLRPCRSEISDDACWLGIRKTKRPKKPQGDISPWEGLQRQPSQAPLLYKKQDQVNGFTHFARGRSNSRRG